MSLFPARLQATLATLPGALRVHALAAAIPYASPPERHTLAKALVADAGIGTDRLPGPHRRIRRWLDALLRPPADTAAARSEIVRLWGWIPAQVRTDVLGCSGPDWRPSVRIAAADPAPEVRRDACEFVAALADPASLPALLPLLHDRSDEVAAAAERAFASLAESALEAGPAGRLAVEKALVPALADYARHRREGVLRAALALADTPFLARVAARDPSALAAAFRDTSSAFHLALRAHVRRARGPLGRARAWQWLGHDLATAAATDRLARAPSWLEHEVILRQAHFLGNPRRLAAVSAIRAGESTLPDAAVLAHLTPAARRGLIPFASVLGLSPERRDDVLGLLLQDPDPSVRFAALRAASGGALERACTDPDPRIAASALRRWSDAGVEPPRAARNRSERAPFASANHEVGAVRRLAAEEHQRFDWTDPHSASGRLAARRRLRDDRIALMTDIRVRLSGGDATSAVMLIRALDLASAFEPDLLPLCSSDNARLRATVVAALGDARSDAARLAVHARLRDPDPRTRANAADALARMLRRSPRPVRLPDILVELKADAHHRVRASAVRARIRHATGVPAGMDALAPLADMLADDRPMHRVAALWLAERLLAPGPVPSARVPADAPAVPDPASCLRDRIVELSCTDPDPAARARARRAAARLVAGGAIAPPRPEAEHLLEKAA